MLSSINIPKILKPDEIAVPKLEFLAKKRERKDQYYTTEEAVGEPRSNDSSVVGSETAFGLHHSSVSLNLRLSSDIIEPPTIEHTPGEPDIWDRLQVRERLQGQGNQRKPKYDAEMDSILCNFRLR